MTVSVSTLQHDRNATVIVAGDVDLATAPAVDTAIEAAAGLSEVSAITVDLSQVTFLDSSGISMLLRGRRVAEEHALDYQVIGARGVVLTVLEVTGVWAHLSGRTG